MCRFDISRGPLTRHTTPTNQLASPGLCIQTFPLTQSRAWFGKDHEEASQLLSVFLKVSSLDTLPFMTQLLLVSIQIRT